MEKITLTEFVTNLFFLVFFSYSLCCILSPKTITTTITTTVSFTNITISLQHFDTTLRFLLSHLKSYQFYHWTISHYSLYLQTLNALFIIDSIILWTSIIDFNYCSFPSNIIDYFFYFLLSQNWVNNFILYKFSLNVSHKLWLWIHLNVTSSFIIVFCFSILFLISYICIYIYAEYHCHRYYCNQHHYHNHHHHHHSYQHHYAMLIYNKFILMGISKNC